MRKIATIFAFCLFISQIAFAQFGNFGDKLKQKAKEALERQTGKTIDKMVGKGEGKIDQKVDETLDGKSEYVVRDCTEPNHNRGRRQDKNGGYLLPSRQWRIDIYTS